MSETKQKVNTKHHPRLMQSIPEDLNGCAALEKMCFSSPWSAESLELLTREGIGVGYVCTQKIPPMETPTVVAYGGMVIAVDEGQITNIAVHPDYRGMGYGKAVTMALIKHAKASRLANITLEVRASNATAVGMYRKLGFAEVGKRKNFYTRPTEDAIIMELKCK